MLNGSPTAAAATRRVFIADDHEGYRSGVARLVGDHPGLEVVGQAADGEQALAGIVACQPDVALLDVRMPGLSGIETNSATAAITNSAMRTTSIAGGG